MAEADADASDSEFGHAVTESAAPNEDHCMTRAAAGGAVAGFYMATAVLCIVFLGLYATGVALLLGKHDATVRVHVQTAHWFIAPVISMLVALFAVLIQFCVQCSPVATWHPLTHPRVPLRIHALFGFRRYGNGFKWTPYARIALFGWILLFALLLTFPVSVGVWFALGLDR
jgi:hypothetical protein